MVNLQKIDDSSVKFVFEDSDHYLFGDGEIVVPVNSLSLVIDDSEMVTFKKSATGDPFISFRADNSNLGTKAAIEAFYKENMVGGSGGVSEEEVQEMIDAATSGIPSSQVIEQLRTDVNTVSGQAQTNASDIEEINEKEEVIASALTEVRQNKQDALQYYSETENDVDGEKESIIEVNQGTDEDYVNAMVETYTQYSENSKSSFVDLSAAVQNDNGGDYSNITVSHNNVSIHSDYVPSEGEMSDAHLDMFNNGNIEIESVSEDGSTVMQIQPTGVTINNERVLTESDGVYYINFATLTTQGIHDADWDGIVAAINAHRPIYAGLGSRYYTAECLSQERANQIIMTASDELNHYFYTFTKNGSENYSFSYTTKPYVPTISTAVTSGSTDSEIPTAKATYDAIQAGGGSTYSAGTNISIDSANTINCTLPITANTSNLTIGSNSFVTDINYGSISLGRNSHANAYRSLAGGEGSNVSLAATNGFAWGIGANVNMDYNAFGAASIGYKTKSTIRNAISIGRYNSIADANTGENFGSSGNTLFAVGNGTSEQTRHNAFEIRQNGDIYVNDGTNDVKLQDTITATAANTTALGGLKFVKCTQAEYDALATKDANTLYIISNVVS